MGGFVFLHDVLSKIISIQGFIYREGSLFTGVVGGLFGVMASWLQFEMIPRVLRVDKYA